MALGACCGIGACNEARQDFAYWVNLFQKQACQFFVFSDFQVSPYDQKDRYNAKCQNTPCEYRKLESHEGMVHATEVRERPDLTLTFHRSTPVNRTRFGAVRLGMFTRCRSARTSAARRARDLNRVRKADSPEFTTSNMGRDRYTIRIAYAIITSDRFSVPTGVSG